MRPSLIWIFFPGLCCLSFEQYLQILHFAERHCPEPHTTNGERLRIIERRNTTTTFRASIDEKTAYATRSSIKSMFPCDPNMSMSDRRRDQQEKDRTNIARLSSWPRFFDRAHFTVDGSFGEEAPHASNYSNEDEGMR